MLNEGNDGGIRTSRALRERRVRLRPGASVARRSVAGV